MLDSNAFVTTTPRRRQTPAPDPIIQRLPLYLNRLRELQADGMAFIASEELGRLLGLCPALVRSDLAHFGAFGVRGVGYEVARLSATLEKILGVHRTWDVVLVGMGDLGCAIAGSEWLQGGVFRLVAVFDENTGQSLEQNGIAAVPLSEAPRWIREHDVKIALLSVPSKDAQAVADLLVDAGVRVILNYTPRLLRVPPDVRTTQFNPVAVLQEMVCHLKDGQEADSQTHVGTLDAAAPSRPNHN